MILYSGPGLVKDIRLGILGQYCRRQTGRRAANATQLMLNSSIMVITPAFSNDISFSPSILYSVIKNTGCYLNDLVNGWEAVSKTERFNLARSFHIFQYEGFLLVQ